MCDGWRESGIQKMLDQNAEAEEQEDVRQKASDTVISKRCDQPIPFCAPV